MHGDPGDPGGSDAPVKAAVEVARLDRGAVTGSEDQAGINPAISLREREQRPVASCGS
jgi:hypothetical protein